MTISNGQNCFTILVNKVTVVFTCIADTSPTNQIQISCSYCNQVQYGGQHNLNVQQTKQLGCEPNQVISVQPIRCYFIDSKFRRCQLPILKVASTEQATQGSDPAVEVVQTFNPNCNPGWHEQLKTIHNWLNQQIMVQEF